jgi:hypothetical protein
MLSWVAAKMARPRRMDAPSESFGSESTLDRSQAESAEVASEEPGVPRLQALTAASDSAVRTSKARCMGDKLFFRTMTDEPLTPDTAEMKARIREVQDRRRDRIRWSIGKHTAELAIAALREPRAYRASSKRRARKRKKRLL